MCLELQNLTVSFEWSVSSRMVALDKCLLVFIWPHAGLEKQLRSTCGRYSVGDEISIADLCIVPQVTSHSPR